MAKKNFKAGIDKSLNQPKRGIDRIFSPTTNTGEIETAGDAQDPETSSGGGELPKAAPKNEELVNYNIRYSKELQKRIKRFCIENDGVDMRDVFIKGAIMYMDNKQ